MGNRYTGPVVILTAVGAGVGGAVANAGTAWAVSQGSKKVKIRKIRWNNLSGIAGYLLVGYGDLTVAGSLFRRIMPDIYMLAGITDGELTEDQIPAGGNTPEGMQPSTVAVTGTTGAILVESTIALGVGTPVHVQIEVEEED